MSILRLQIGELVTRQVDKKSGGCQRREGSGILEEEIGVWDSQGGGKDKCPFFFFPFLSSLSLSLCIS